VILVGVDGATWTVMDPLLEAGELPHFASLIERGCRGAMKSLWPSLSPAIWTSIATGVAPGRHGMTNFTYKKDGRAHLYTSDMVQVERVWDIASRAGRRVGVTNFWFTYPATPVNGYLLSDHAIPARSARIRDRRTKGEDPRPERAQLATPAALLDRVGPVLDQREPRIGGAPGEGREQETVTTLLREDEQVVEMARLAAGDDPPELEILYVRAIDGVSHRHWIHFEPDHPHYEGKRPSPEDLERFTQAVPGAYRHADALLGEVLERVAPEDVVIVVSDHGHGAVVPYRDVTGGHGKDPATLDGIYVMAGGPVDGSACQPEISLFDVAPTILHLLGLSVPTEMQGDVALGGFAPGWVAANPVERTGEPLALPPASAAPARMSELEEEHRLALLRALGYAVD